MTNAVKPPPTHNFTSRGESPAARQPKIGLRRAAGALLWKEFHEVSLVAVLAACAYSVLLIALIYTVASHDRYSGESTAIPDMLTAGVTMLLSAAAAIAVGFRQFFPEAQPQRFGFHVHRAVPRALIFWCKAAAGIGAYLLAMFIPLLGALLWVRNPEHVPLPFTWWQALAPVSDILLGVPFYFAGVLIAQRTDSAWIGSRLLPAAGLVFLMLMNVVAVNFASALLAIVIASVWMAVAARDYYLASGQYARTRGPARFLLGVNMLAGMLVLGVFALFLVELLTTGGRHVALTTRGSEIHILDDGRVVLVEDKDGVATIRDLPDGNVTTMPAAPIRSGAVLPSLPMFWIEPTYPFSDRLHNTPAYFARTRLFGTGEWFFAQSKLGEDYVVGFNIKEKWLLGALGAKGLEDGRSVPTVRFEKPVTVFNGMSTVSTMTSDSTYRPASRPMLSSASTLYIAGLENVWSLTPIFKTPNHEPILHLGAVEVFPSAEVISGQSAVRRAAHPVVITKDSIFILSAREEIDRRPTESTVLVRLEEPNIAEHGISVGILNSPRRFVIALRSLDFTMEDSGPGKVVIFDEQGKLQKAIELPATGTEYVVLESWVERFAIPTLSPPAGTALFTGVNWLSMEPKRFNQGLPYLWRVAALSGVTAAVTALVTLVLARRRQMGRRAWLWAILALALGPAGLLLLFALAGLPLMVKCPSCGTRRRVNFSVCPHCQAGWLVPAKNGTEIFA